MVGIGWLLERLPGSFQVKRGMALAWGEIAEANLPPCDATRRGEIRAIPGAAGVADKTMICRKDDADAYGWVNGEEHDHDADYAALGHTHDAAYVNVSGDTMTDTLTITRNASNLVLDTPVAGQAAEVRLSDAGTETWRLRKDGNNRLSFWNSVAGRDAFRINDDDDSVFMQTLNSTGPALVTSTNAGVLGRLSDLTQRTSTCNATAAGGVCTCTATCPANTIAISGGYTIGTTGQIRAYNNYRASATTWSVSQWNDNPTLANTITCYVWCI